MTRALEMVRSHMKRVLETASKTSRLKENLPTLTISYLPRLFVEDEQ